MVALAFGGTMCAAVLRGVPGGSKGARSLLASVLAATARDQELCVHLAWSGASASANHGVVCLSWFAIHACC